MFASAHPSAQSVQAHPFWPGQCRTNNLLATVCRWADHAVTLAVAGFVTRGSVECMKLCRDFNRLAAGVWP